MTRTLIWLASVIVACSGLTINLVLLYLSYADASVVVENGVNGPYLLAVRHRVRRRIMQICLQVSLIGGLIIRHYNAPAQPVYTGWFLLSGALFLFALIVVTIDAFLDFRDRRTILWLIRSVLHISKQKEG